MRGEDPLVNQVNETGVHVMKKEDIEERRRFMIEWCKKRYLNPGNKYNWKMASEAYDAQKENQK